MAEPVRSKALSELVRKSRERLAKFPLWITSGDLRDYDEWLLGREPSQAEKVQRLTGREADLDVLERDLVNPPDHFGCGWTGVDHIALIQRLREADAARKELFAGWNKAESEIGVRDHRIAQLEAQLERVRLAAIAYIADDRGVYALRAALAGVEAEIGSRPFFGGAPGRVNELEAQVAQLAKAARKNTQCWVDLAAADTEIPTDENGDCPGCALLVSLAELRLTGKEPNTT